MDSQPIEEIAARWVARRYDDAWTDADQVRLEEWLQAATAHRISYIRLETAWSEAARLQALGAGAPAGGRQNGVAAGEIGARQEDGPHDAGKRGGAAHIGGRG